MTAAAARVAAGPHASADAAVLTRRILLTILAGRRPPQVRLGGLRPPIPARRRWARRDAA